jgi:alpha-tubulin suppressor-like RCC1 family protein
MFFGEHRMLILCAPYRVVGNSLYASGYNFKGELSLPNSRYHWYFTQVDFLSQFTKIFAVGQQHAFGIKSDGSLWAWGSNSYGQLGLGNTTARTSPTRVGTATWVTISGFGDSVMGIQSDGSLWSWGNNTYGQLGLGDKNSRLVPTKVGVSTDWTAICMGVGHGAGLRGSTVNTWGYGAFGQLGTGDTAERLSPTPITGGAAKLVAGNYTTMYVSTGGRIYGTGFNNAGSLGIGTTGTSILSFREAAGSATNWRDISCAGDVSAALTTSNILYTWGSNSQGALGLGDYTNRSAPTLARYNCSKVYVGSNAINAIQTDNTLYGSGNGLSLGIGHLNDVNTFIPLSYDTFSSVSPASSYAFFVRPDGTTFFAGHNTNNYLLGSEHTASYLTVTDTQFKGKIDSISMGFYHSVLVDSKDSSLWTVGDNQYGQLGDGTTKSKTTFTKVSTGTWQTVSCGATHNLAIQSDGKLATWGRNNYGQLGNGVESSASNWRSPAFIQPADTWGVASSGGWHSAAIRRDGTLWTWGYNNNGQLGLGDTVNRSTPVNVGGNDWVQVSSGSNSTAGIKSDGSLWTWGLNSSGQLGLGDTVNRSVPTVVPGSWIAVKCGYVHVVAIKSDGSLWTWGSNTYGQLGLGDTTNRLAPTRIGIDNNWSRIFAEAQSNGTFAKKTDGTSWGWGANYGNLGMGAGGNAVTPTLLNHEWSNVTSFTYGSLFVR